MKNEYVHYFWSNEGVQDSTFKQAPKKYCKIYQGYVDTSKSLSNKDLVTLSLYNESKETLFRLSNYWLSSHFVVFKLAEEHK